MQKLYKIAANTPFSKGVLTYASLESYKNGQIVTVPLGKRTVLGVVLEEVSQSDIEEEKLKTICGLEDKLTIPEKELEFFKWISKYYHYSLGSLIFESYPKKLKRPQELKSLQGKNIPLDKTLTQEQREIVNSLRCHFETLKHEKFLIHGVTGSGKTYVYLEAIKKILSSTKSALLLLPEINLTFDVLKFFSDHLDVPIYSYNSALSKSQKYGLVKKLQNDFTPKLIIGVRSAIFLPIEDLGLIIVDEEHDASFKQEDRCPYNARDLALYKASLYKIPIILASATPSFESWFHFTHKEINHYYTLKKRALSIDLPRIQVVGLKDKSQNKDYSPSWPFMEESLKSIKDTLQEKEQFIVFINRLGHASFIQCRACGHQFTCPNCSVSLKYFKSREELYCQYCNYTIPYPSQCPECSNLKLLQKGFGTESIEELLIKNIPGIKSARFDRDEIKTISSLEKRLKSFHTGQLDALVGTQMLSKGHNFEKVNLVLVFGTDTLFNLPDFRSTEKVYQILTQISGRAGRFSKQGKVLIHTLTPSHPIFDVIKKNSFDEFYLNELNSRKISMLPPFSKLVAVYFNSRYSKEAMDSALLASKLLKEHFQELEVLGPRPALIEKKKNKYTWTLLLKSKAINTLHNACSTLQSNVSLFKKTELKIDVDPYQLS